MFASKYDEMLRLSDEERLDVVNDGVKLIQRKNGLTFGTDALLLAGFIDGTGNKVCAELGGGTGIISFLLLTRKKAKKIYVYEIQEAFAELIQRNAIINSLDEKICVIQKDVRQATSADTCGEVDIVFSNPPYMKAGSGKLNEFTEKTVARHEVCGDISDFCKSAARLLKFGGDFYVVYPPDRMAELFDAMKKASIEPKALTLVYPTLRHRPCLILCKGKKGAKAGMIQTPPLVINDQNGESEEYDYIMKNGEFNELYKKV